MKRVITRSDVEYISAHYLTQSDGDMANALGRERSAVRRTRRKLGLSVSDEVKQERRAKALRGRTVCTPEHDQILRDNYLAVPKRVLAEMIGHSETCVVTRLRQLGLVIPAEILEQRKADSLIKKGNVPPNKGKKGIDHYSDEAKAAMARTTFKKGSIPPNRRPVGFERISKDGYIEVKVAEGMHQFRAKHRVIYEEHFGPIPKGHIVVFRDYDQLNCAPENLLCITYEENMKRNSVHNLPKEVALTVQLRGALNRQVNKKLKQIRK